MTHYAEKADRILGSVIKTHQESGDRIPGDTAVAIAQTYAILDFAEALREQLAAARNAQHREPGAELHVESEHQD